MKCAAVGCANRTGEGTFVGELCHPCWSFVHENNDNRNRTTAAWARELTDDTLEMFQDEEPML